METTSNHGWSQHERDGLDRPLYRVVCNCGWRSLWYADPDLAWRAAERRDADHGNLLRGAV